MGSLETKETKYFLVYDPTKRKNGRCSARRMAKLNSVPVECSCSWPLLFGGDPNVLLHMQTSQLNCIYLHVFSFALSRSVA